MNFFSTKNTLSLFLLLAAAAPAAAQSEQRDARDARPGETQQDNHSRGWHRAEERRQQRRDAERQRQQRAEEQRQQRRQHTIDQRQQRYESDRQRQQAERDRRHPMPPAPPVPLPNRDWQNNRGWDRNGSWQNHDTWQEHRSDRWDNDHRTWQQRGGYEGIRIGLPFFSLHFGPSHVFRIGGRPEIYMGHPRFSYQGSSFVMVDPYPASWGENWYNDDDVYIDYNDGYYLHNRRDPGVAIAVNIVE